MKTQEKMYYENWRSKSSDQSRNNLMRSFKVADMYIVINTNLTYVPLDLTLSKYMRPSNYLHAQKNVKHI